MEEKSLLLKWAALLQQRSWSFLVNKSKHLLVLNVSKDGVSHPIKVQFKEDAHIVISTLSYQQKTPPEYRDQMIKLINRINLEISIGGFEMDRRDGEVRFRHSVDVESISYTDVFVQNFMNIIALTGCKYYHSIFAAMNGNIEEAFNSL